MFKKFIVMLIVVFLAAGIGFAKPPKISGNFEQGARYALPYDETGFPTPWVEATEGDAVETWAYNFHKGYLKLYHRLNKTVRYIAKYNYIWKDFHAAKTNNKNILRYFRTYSWIKLSNKFDLKLEYYLRQQHYYIRPWDNLEHVPHLYLKWDINKKRKANFSLRFKSQRYDVPEETTKDKNQISSYARYKEEIGENLTLKAKYKYTFRHYTANPDKSNAVKKSLSGGFEYQF